MKRTYYITIIAIFLSINFSATANLRWIPFLWEGDSISGKYIDKAYIYIPVQIENIPLKFTMQFDLGTPQSVFYEKTMHSIMQKDSSLSHKWNDKTYSFQHISLTLGKETFCDIELKYMKNTGTYIPEKDLYKRQPIHIGTIGSDIFQNKVLIIDYKNQRIAITNSIPNEYKETQAIRFTIENGIIKLPFLINNQECQLMFDTGSSPFELVTNQNRALKIADPTIIDSLSGPLWWGKNITFYGLNVTKPVIVAGKTRPTSKVFYDKDGLWNSIFDAYQIWGITGNAYFYDTLIIIDYINNLFYAK